MIAVSYFSIFSLQLKHVFHQKYTFPIFLLLRVFYVLQGHIASRTGGLAEMTLLCFDSINQRRHDVIKERLRAENHPWHCGLQCCVSWQVEERVGNIFKLRP